MVIATRIPAATPNEVGFLPHDLLVKLLPCYLTSVPSRTNLLIINGYGLPMCEELTSSLVTLSLRIDILLGTHATGNMGLDRYVSKWRVPLRMLRKAKRISSIAYG